MGQPTNAHVFWRPGANGAATDDETAIIGAINGAATLTPAEEGQIIEAGEVNAAGGLTVVHYGGCYVELDEGAGGSILTARLNLLNGGIATPSSNTLLITDPTGENEGLELVAAGIVGGAPFFQDDLVIDSGSAELSSVLDNATLWWVATKDNAALSGVAGTDDLVITCGGTQVGRMLAPKSGAYANGMRVCSSIYQIAVANAVDETISASNRLTVPSASSGITAFSSGANLTGSDGRIDLGTFADETYRGIVLKRNMPAGLRIPDQGLPHFLAVTGLAST